MTGWTDAEREWANDHNACEWGNECWNDCATYWLEEARRVLSGERDLRVRMAEEQVVGPAAEQPEDEDQRQ